MKITPRMQKERDRRRAARMEGEQRPDTVPVRFMEKEHFLLLRKIEKKAKARFAQGISDAGLANLPDDVRCPVLWTMLHNDGEIRARVAVTEDCIIWVDMPIEVYGDLPGRFVRKEIAPTGMFI